MAVFCRGRPIANCFSMIYCCRYFTETEENSTMMAPRNTVPYFL